MESSKPQEHRAIGQIQQLLGSSGKLDASEINLQDFSRILTKMPQRQNKDVVTSIVNKLFDLAAQKMKEEGDREVLENLRKYVGMVEEDLYNTKPRYLDTMFFPNETNVDRLVQYMAKATKSLKICVFTITNNKLANAVRDAHKRGIQVRVITDDECMQQIGSDVHWLSE